MFGSLRSEPLHVQVKLLEDILDEYPDPWFHECSGKVYVKLTGLWKTRFSLKWFEIEETKIAFYSDQKRTKLNYEVNLRDILSVDFSSNLKPHSLDLITTKASYILSFECHIRMIKWTLALKIIISEQNINLYNNLIPSTDKDHNLEPYEITFIEKGPLHITFANSSLSRKSDGKFLKNFIVIEGFELDENGNKGRGELSGKMNIGDILIGINNKDILHMDINDVMNILIHTEWPLKLQLLRDISSTPRLSGWIYVYYGNHENLLEFKKRKVYMEYIGDYLYWKRPSLDHHYPRNHRDTMIPLQYQKRIEKTYDLKSVKKPYKGVIHITFPESTYLTYDTVLSQSIKEEITAIFLCFHDYQEFSKWEIGLEAAHVDPSSLNGNYIWSTIIALHQRDASMAADKDLSKLNYNNSLEKSYNSNDNINHTNLPTPTKRSPSFHRRKSDHLNIENGNSIQNSASCSSEKFLSEKPNILQYFVIAFYRTWKYVSSFSPTEFFLWVVLVIASLSIIGLLPYVLAS